LWDEKYQKLSNYEKGEFRRLANYLLSHTYLVRDKYDSSKMMMIVNEDYRTVSRLFEVLFEYFDVTGWRLKKDDNYGVISLYNIYESNRLRIDRFTTLMLYTFRLIYEEEREKVAGNRDVRTDTVTVISKMQSLGLIYKKPAIRDFIDAQRTIAHYNIIQKIESKWENDGNKLIIHPSILTIISNEGINNLATMLEDVNSTTYLEEMEDDAE
jgi:hypothetical protein